MLIEHERTSGVEWDCQNTNNILTSILANGINFLMCNLISMMGTEDLDFQHLFRSCSSKPFPKGSLLFIPPTPAPSSVGVGGHGGEVTLFSIPIAHTPQRCGRCKSNFLWMNFEVLTSGMVVWSLLWELFNFIEQNLSDWPKRARMSLASSSVGEEGGSGVPACAPVALISYC